MLKNLKKKNKGFTLVELIVVIVILAILIGVTIGGIYKYVSQSRVNTDINNASSLQSTLSSMCAEQGVYDWANTDGVEPITFTWQEAVPAKDIAALITAEKDAQMSDAAHKLSDRIAELCPDGLPASKTKKDFKFTINPNNKNPKVLVTTEAGK